ncbi:hypothetical protein ACFL35_11330 [Candidatus Riflebacteria bacterium]
MKTMEAVQTQKSLETPQTPQQSVPGSTHERENDLTAGYFKESKTVLRVLPKMNELSKMSVADLKKIFAQLEKECFLCDSFIKKDKLEDEESWHLLHCIGSTLISLNP